MAKHDLHSLEIKKMQAYMKAGGYFKNVVLPKYSGSLIMTDIRYDDNFISTF